MIRYVFEDLSVVNKSKLSAPLSNHTPNHTLTGSFIGKVAAIFLATTLLSSCGGGSGDSAASPTMPTTPISNDFEPGVFQASSVFFNQCANPAADQVNTQTNQAYGSGTVTDENNWLRSWSNELYLWYDEITDQNPAEFATSDYFELMKTTAVTASGNDRDRFHFTVPTQEWLESSESGVVSGYGTQVALLASSPPREIAIAYTEPGTPAAAEGVARGARILTIDGEDAINGNDVDTLNNGLFPASVGETHTFEIQDLGSTTTRTVSLTSAEITTTPVQNVGTIATASGTVGYLTFNDHIRPAEDQLIAAVNQLRAANIDDLVLDVRYNGGGFLFIASQLAYMIAGNAATSGQAFETLTFNDQHPDTDPVTGDTIQALPFYNVSTNDESLPSLNLSRVYVLTGSSTCSASESIINSLDGIGVQVIQIGATTCGKPYGFYPTDNCGTTYFSIQFRGENNAGFGDYPDGFSPFNATQPGSVRFPGCEVEDDFNAVLGDSNEARLAAALEFRETGACPATSAVASNLSTPEKAAKARLHANKALNVQTPKPAWLQNRLIQR
ncbi:MAG: S41 family peptidase [Pseudomonadales bacterium]